MAIDPHQLSESRPLPVSAGWASGRRGIIPEGSFKPETLKEAVAILQGTSQRYRISEAGALEKIEAGVPMPEEPPVSVPSISKEEGDAAWDAYITCDNAMEDEEEAHGTETERYHELKAEAEQHRAVSDGYHESLMQSLMQTHVKKAEGFLRTSKDFSDAERQSLYAALCIVANAALKQKPPLNLEEHIKLTVHSHHYKPGPDMQLALDYFRMGGEPAPLSESMKRTERECMRELYPLGETLGGIQETIATFHAGGTIEQEWPHYKLYRGQDLLKLAVSNARFSRDTYSHDEIWPLHNQFPDAVNFLLAAPQAEFLLNRDGTRQPITENLQHFLNSEWMEMAGNLDLKIDPELLSITRQALDTYPWRDPAKNTAVLA